MGGLLTDHCHQAPQEEAWLWWHTQVHACTSTRTHVPLSQAHGLPHSGDPGPILTSMKPTLEEATVSLTSLKGKQEG